MTDNSYRADACTQNTDQNNLHHLKSFKKSKLKRLAIHNLISQIKHSHAQNMLTDEEMNIIGQFITALVKAKTPVSTEGK